MPRTYETTMAEIEKIQAEQRAITQKADPSADDKAFLLSAEGEITALRNVANDLHEAEVAELKAAAERAKPLVETADSGMSEFRQALMNLQPGQELELRSWASNTGSGSYMVPQEWHDKVEEYKFEANWMRPGGAMVVKTESTHNIPVLTALSTPTIVGENTAYTASDPTVGQVILYAYKLSDKVLVSEELLADAAYDVPGALARAMGLGFGKAELNYCMTGTGSSQPTGIFNKTADLTTDTQNVITADELLEVIYGLQAEYREGAVFMMDQLLAYYISTLKTPVTTSGGQNYQFPGMLDGKTPSIFGYDVKFATAIPDRAAGAKALAFGNPANYVIGERGPMAIKRLALNEYGDTFAFAQRFDGKPLNESAFYVVALHS